MTCTADTINAAWLDALLAPNPLRDVLAWLKRPGSDAIRMGWCTLGCFQQPLCQGFWL